MARKFYVLIAIVAWVAGGSVQLGWAQEWEKVLEAAKKEGKVSLIGPVGGDRRDVLASPSRKNMASRWSIGAIAAPVSAHGYRLNATPASISGTLPSPVPPPVCAAASRNMLDPMEPALILPR